MVFIFGIKRYLRNYILINWSRMLYHCLTNTLHIDRGLHVTNEGKMYTLILLNNHVFSLSKYAWIAGC